MAKHRSPKLEKSCPLRQTHTRLHQTHTQWHRAQQDYADPDDFVTSLNAALVTLRSVEEMLKKEKSSIPDFDAWNAPHVARFKADTLMRWLVKSRNTVVHESDLELHSTARVRLLGGPGEPPEVDIAVPPLMTQDEIVQLLLDDFPDAAKHDALLSVERRWVASTLKDHELLEVLAYGYGVVAAVVADAHRQCGVIMQNFGDEDHGPLKRRREQLGGRLSCMVAHAQDRTAYGHLAAGRLIGIGSQTRDITREDVEGIELPPGMTGAAPFHVRGQHLLDQADGLAAAGKALLASIGGHEPMAFVFREPDSAPEIVNLRSQDRTTQTLVMEALANDVEKHGAAGVIFFTILLRPEGQPDEFLVAAVTADGGQRQWLTPLAKSTGDRYTIAGNTVRTNGTVPEFMKAITRKWEGGV